jgi:hypothetical protein
MTMWLDVCLYGQDLAYDSAMRSILGETWRGLD